MDSWLNPEYPGSPKSVWKLFFYGLIGAIKSLPEAGILD
jgi:hypothetical protein